VRCRAGERRTAVWRASTAARPNCPGERRQQKIKDWNALSRRPYSFQASGSGRSGGSLCHQRTITLTGNHRIGPRLRLADDHRAWHHPAVCGLVYTRRSQFRRTDPCPRGAVGWFREDLPAEKQNWCACVLKLNARSPSRSLRARRLICGQAKGHRVRNTGRIHPYSSGVKGGVPAA